MRKEPIMIGLEIRNEPVLDENDNGTNWIKYRQGPIDQYIFTFSDKSEFEYHIDKRRPLSTLSVIVRKIAEKFFINKTPWPKKNVFIILESIKELEKDDRTIAASSLDKWPPAMSD